MEKDEDKKKDLIEKAAAGPLPKFLKTMECALEKNGSGWLVGNDVTWADLNLACMITFISGIAGEDQLNKMSPKMAKFLQKVMDLPRIKEHLAKKPVSTYVPGQ